MTFDIELFRSMPLRSESEIKSRWRNISPTVSVICTTYNQEQYIEDAIRGFLLQETDFSFEIIIHDDASTDQTLNILYRYQDRYPNLIKLVTQNFNQYSQGKQIISLVVPYAKADYIAICEGDDFWIDAKKLQTQMNFLLEQPNFDICFHSVKTIIKDDIVLPSEVRNSLPAVVKLINVIAGGGSYMPTASLILKKSIIQNLPDWFHKMPIGDYFIQVYGSLNGALFLSNEMAAYRMLATNSWTRKMKDDSQLRIRNEKKILLGINCLDKELGTRFEISHGINKARANIIFNILYISIKSGNYKSLFEGSGLSIFRHGHHLIVAAASRLLKMV